MMIQMKPRMQGRIRPKQWEIKLREMRKTFKRDLILLGPCFVWLLGVSFLDNSDKKVFAIFFLTDKWRMHGTVNYNPNTIIR